MKKILSAFAALTLAVMTITSCGRLGNSAANANTSTSGSTTGNLLTALLAQYLKDGSNNS